MTKPKSKAGSLNPALFVFVSAAYISGSKGEQVKVEAGTTAEDAQLTPEQVERYLAKGMLDHVDNVVATAGKSSGELRAEVTTLLAQVKALQADALKTGAVLERLKEAAPDVVASAEAEIEAELAAAE